MTDRRACTQVVLATLQPQAAPRSVVIDTGAPPSDAPMADLPLVVMPGHRIEVRDDYARFASTVEPGTRATFRGVPRAGFVLHRADEQDELLIAVDWERLP